MANLSGDSRLYQRMDADCHGGGSSLSRCTKVKAAAAAAEEKALKKTKTEEEAKVMAAVEEEEPERMVYEGKRMVKKRLPMEKVLRALAIDPKPHIINAPGIGEDPVYLASMKLRQFGIEKIRELQDTVREDLRTKGYVLGWVTDDDE